MGLAFRITLVDLRYSLQSTSFEFLTPVEIKFSMFLYSLYRLLLSTSFLKSSFVRPKCVEY